MVNCLARLLCHDYSVSVEVGPAVVYERQSEWRTLFLAQEYMRRASWLGRHNNHETSVTNEYVLLLHMTDTRTHAHAHTHFVSLFIHQCLLIVLGVCEGLRGEGWRRDM